MRDLLITQSTLTSSLLDMSLASPSANTRIEKSGGFGKELLTGTDGIQGKVDRGLVRRHCGR